MLRLPRVAENQKNTKIMQANELRIGNLIYKRLKSGNGRTINGEVGCQDIVKIFEDIGSFIYEPILLTEEWLLKFGFRVFPWGWVKKSKRGFGIRLNIKTYSYEIDGNPAVKLEYVHQIQNLYFILTGEELELSQV